MKNKILMSFIILLSFSCGNQTSLNNDCLDCGAGLTNGFFYKEIVFEDIASNLIEINSSASVIGTCIRFKKDGVNFLEAYVVADCCCIEFQ